MTTSTIVIRHHPEGLRLLLIEKKEREIDRRELIVLKEALMHLAGVLDLFWVCHPVFVHTDEDRSDRSREVGDPRTSIDDDLIVASIRMDLHLLNDHLLEVLGFPRTAPIEDTASRIAPPAATRDAVVITSRAHLSLRSTVGEISAVNSQLARSQNKATPTTLLPSSSPACINVLMPWV